MTRATDDANQTDLIAGYVLDDLSAEEAARLRQALADSPAGAEEVGGFEEAIALLPYALPVSTPSAGLRNKILSAAQGTSSGEATETPPSNVVPLKGRSMASSSERSRRQWLPAISSGIAAVALVALGLNQVQLSKQSQQTVALQQQLEETNRDRESLRSKLSASEKVTALLNDPSTQIHALVGADSEQPDATATSARVLVKPGDREVTLVAQNLPQLPEDQIYRFWSVTEASATPQYCGEFRQDSSGTAQWTAVDAACLENPLQTMITLDAPNDPTTLPGPTVMESIS